MKTRFFHEADGWTQQGLKITDPATLKKIEHTLEEAGPIIIEHWFYRGASGPDRLTFDDYDEFIKYLHEQASAGDIIHVWSFADVCHNANRIAHGKCPDETGRVPERGAY